MKLYNNIRQTRTSEQMIKDLAERIIRWRSQRELENLDSTLNVLMVSTNYDNSSISARKLIDEIKRTINNAKSIKNQNMYIVTINDPTVFTVNITYANDSVTLHDLKEYDFVMIDDVFVHHPYNERILIRGTVDFK